jgi:hypothetical protein
MIGPGATGGTWNEKKRGSGAVSLPRRQTRSLQGTPAVRDTADFPWVKYVLEFVAPGAAGVCRALDAPLRVRLGR